MAKDRSLLKALAVALASAIVVSVSGVIYTGISNQENNRQWCELLVPLDNAYTTQQPASTLGKSVAAAIHRLRNNFHC